MNEKNCTCQFNQPPNGVFSNKQGTIVIKNVATIVTNDPSTTQKLRVVIFRGIFTNKTTSNTHAADFFQKVFGGLSIT